MMSISSQVIVEKVWYSASKQVIGWYSGTNNYFINSIYSPVLYSEKSLMLYRLIGLVGRVFANGPGDLGSIPGRVIPKTLKMVLDTSWLNNQRYKVCIKGKVEQFRERSSVLS